MQIQRLHHLANSQQAILVRHDQAPQNHNVWHYHPEFEFIQITKGRGTFFVGDCIFKFKDGDSMLIGSEVPHYWLFDDDHIFGKSETEVDIRVIHFMPDFMGKDFLQLKEAKTLLTCYARAKRVLYLDSSHTYITAFFTEIIQQPPFQQLLSLLGSLDYMAQQEDAQLLVSAQYNNLQQDVDYERMNKVLQHIRLGYRDKIQLQTVAHLAGLTENSFCRYFKQKTGKTLVQFTNELRISHACKLLSDNRMAIKEICFDCGFQNFVSFHKTFKQVTKLTPIQYRNKALNGDR